MPSKEWNKYSSKEIRDCLLRLSDNFLNYSGNAFSKKESKSISDLVLYYAGMTDKWLEISGYDNNILSGKISKKQPVGNVNITVFGKADFFDFMKAVLPAMVSGNEVTVSNFIPGKKKEDDFFYLLNKSHIPAGTINITGKLDILSLERAPQESPGDIEKYTLTKEILY